MRNDRGIQQAVETHARDVDDKLRHHRNVVDRAQQLQAQKDALYEVESSLKRASFGDPFLFEDDVPPDPELAIILHRQSTEMRNGITQTTRKLREEKELATVHMAGWDAHVASCQSEPYNINEYESVNAEDEDTKFDKHLADLLALHQAHAANLAEYHSYLLSSLAAASDDDAAAKNFLEAIAEDIREDVISARHVENAANQWRAAKKTRSQEGAVRYRDKDEFRNACYGPSVFDRRTSAVVDHFMNLTRPTSHTYAPTVRTSTHRAPARTRRAHAGHGATAKAGDDGDGGDGGDGEPPRPRTSNPPTPPLHHSLTTHSLIAGGAQ